MLPGMSFVEGGGAADLGSLINLGLQLFGLSPGTGGVPTTIPQALPGQGFQPFPVVVGNGGGPHIPAEYPPVVYEPTIPVPVPEQLLEQATKRNGRRRMNALNPSALKRAATRLEQFRCAVRRIEKLVPCCPVRSAPSCGCRGKRRKK